jgi:hypothetical protein
MPAPLSAQRDDRDQQRRNQGHDLQLPYQLGITLRASSDSSGYIFETKNRVSAAHVPFSSDTPT